MHRFVVVFLALLVFHLYFYAQPLPLPGTLSFLIFTLTFHLLIWLSFKPALKFYPTSYALITSLLAIFSSAISLFHASAVDRFLLFLVTTSLSAISLYLLALTHSRFGSLSEILAVPFRLLTHSISAFFNLYTQGFNRLLSRQSTLKNHSQKSISILRGLLLTLPFAFLIILLLSSADPIFSHTLSRIFNLHLGELTQTIFNRLIASLFITHIAATIISLKITRRFRSPLNINTYSRYSTEALILTSTIAIILGFFLIIQFRYLFASVPETALHQFGLLTFSEYVRRGFVELVLVSAIVYFAVGLSYLVYRQNPSHRFHLLANFILLSEALIFILSIFRRLYLYQSAHGLTRIRFYGMFFLFIIISATLILIARHFFKRRLPFYLLEFSAMIFFAFLATTVKVDRLIAQSFPPTVNQEIDYTYIARLSPDALSGWIQAHRQVRQFLDDHPQLTKDHPYSLETARQIRYHYLTLLALKDHFHYLQTRYSQEIFIPSTTPTPNYYLKPNEPSLYHYNFAESKTYDRLHQELDLDQFLSDLSTLEIAHHQVMQTFTYSDFDRSFSSPLVD